MKKFNYDPQEVKKTLQLMCSGNTFEIRALQAQLDGKDYTGIVSGFFNDPDLAVKELARITAASGIYYTLNPVDPTLLARVNNRLRIARKNEAVGDKDITAQITLLIDIDPVRLSGTSATNEQKLAAKSVVSKIWKELEPV